MGVRIWVEYLVTGCFFDEWVLRSRRHAVFSDMGGLGVGHFERDELMELWGDERWMNRVFVSKLGG